MSVFLCVFALKRRILLLSVFLIVLFHKLRHVHVFVVKASYAVFANGQHSASVHVRTKVASASGFCGKCKPHALIFDAGIVGVIVTA